MYNIDVCITYKYKIYNPTLLQCYTTHLYTKHDINKSKDKSLLFKKNENIKIERSKWQSVKKKVGKLY